MPSNVFIFEGPDLAGKSTLAAQLKSHIEDDGASKVTIRHFAAPSLEHLADPSQYFAYLSQVIIDDVAASLHDPLQYFIYDRLHIGDVVYGSLLRHKRTLTERHIDLLEDLCSTFEVRRYFVDPGNAIIARRYAERSEQLSLTTVLAAAAFYRHYFQFRPGWDVFAPGMEIIV